jgi:hypothetical protein
MIRYPRELVIAGARKIESAESSHQEDVTAAALFRALITRARYQYPVRAPPEGAGIQNGIDSAQKLSEVGPAS